MPGDDPAKDAIDPLLRTIDRQNQLLETPAEALFSIAESIRARDQATSSRNQVNPTEFNQEREAAQEIWQSQILCFNIHDSKPDISREFTSEPDTRLEDILGLSRPWRRWAYAKSYPRLAAFFASAQLDEVSKAHLVCEERYDNGHEAKVVFHDPVIDHLAVWKAIRNRVNEIEDRVRLDPDESDNDSEKPREKSAFAESRLLRITDLSPLLAAILIRSTPRPQISVITPFLERYLAFSNWAQASFWSQKWLTTNSFTFEYHLSFFFVPSSIMEPDLAMKDFRKLRKAAPFGPDPQQPSRWIYEEQMSFILTGLGPSIWTCYQLGEKYYRGPYIGTGGFDSIFINSAPAWSPSAKFLSWINFALYHVNWRWHHALTAVNNKIDTSAAIVFHEGNPDLLADDPSFSRSRTYFWALQVYDLFDKAITSTLDTWHTFKQDSLARVDDGRLPDGLWESTLGGIESAVSQLEAKREVVRERAKEVESLRAGLFGASALFDSRTAVRQGDNLRLLTYISLLYLPLTFVTSLFGMQVVLPSLPTKVFAITLPVVFLVSVLLVFNLQHILDGSDAVLQNITERLRRVMRRHHRREWRVAEEELKRDRMVHQTPIQKIPRLSSHWMYVLFALDAALLQVPVHEIRWAATSLKNTLSPQRQPPDPTHKSENGFPHPQAKPSRAARVKAFKLAQAHAANRSTFASWARSIAGWMAAALRSILLAVWVPLVTTEYVILLLAVAPFQTSPSTSSTLPPQAPFFIRPLLWQGFQPGKYSKKPEDAADASDPDDAAPAEAAKPQRGTHRRLQREASIPLTRPDKGSAALRRWRRLRYLHDQVSPRDGA